jgi:hypothetical protein
MPRCIPRGEHDDRAVTILPGSSRDGAAAHLVSTRAKPAVPRVTLKVAASNVAVDERWLPTFSAGESTAETWKRLPPRRAELRSRVSAATSRVSDHAEAAYGKTLGARTKYLK